MKQVGYPLRFDSRGRTAEPGEHRRAAPSGVRIRAEEQVQDAHVRELIEQVLFTSPGERVNRPGFGSGLHQLVFAPNSDTLAGATQLLVRGALQQELSDLIEVENVQIDAVEATLTITVEYIVRRTQQRDAATFVRGGGPS